MSGTLEGGAKTAATNKTKYGESYYANIGAMGGKAKVPKGFALMDKQKVAEAGRKGGQVSKRSRASDYL